MKKIVKNFNNLVKKTIFKLQNKTNNNFKISNFNKYLITLISLLFFYLFYLSIPLLYGKTWVQNHIENILFEEFKINFSISSDISYNILPTPHFSIKNSKIFNKNDEKIRSLAEIKNIKVFIDQSNFFDKEKMNINKVLINNANFSFLGKDFKLLNDSSNNIFSTKKIKIKDSNIFFKDNLNQTIAIIKISKASLFFDDDELSNLFELKGETFNIPFKFDLNKEFFNTEKKFFNIYAKILKLKIFNSSNKNDENLILGNNIISVLNSKIHTKYSVNEKLINFESRDSKTINSKVKYNGQLSIIPFDLKLNINLEDHRSSKLLNLDSILIDFFQTELLYNENISIHTSINTKSKSRDEIFNSTKINFNIINGKVNFDETKLISDKIGIVELNNSNLFFESNKLILNTNVIIDIQKSKNLFSLLQTPKNSRKQIKSIFFNLDYDLLANQIEFNYFKINGAEVDNEILRILESFNEIKDNNLNKSRQILNKLLSSYEG